MALLPSISAGLLPGVLQEFTRKHPGIPVQIRDLVAERIIEAVKKEEVDFGVGTRLRLDRDLKMTPLFTDRLSAEESSADEAGQSHLARTHSASTRVDRQRHQRERHS
jgi:DNA-binding transcriptional LysR family regulator